MKKISLFLFIALYALSSQAQSFDCEKAGNVTEKTICSDDRLKKLDSELDVVYGEAFKKAVSVCL